MIKTLRLTGVAAVAFAGLVLASVLGPVSLIRFDDQSDQQMGQILAAPGAVERFHELHGGKRVVSPDTTPPLVRQAELFKDIIDPKPLPQAPTPSAVASIARPTQTPRPPRTTPKFTLIGTSCSVSNPDSSFAYIFVDNAYKWVQCGDDIGYMTIKEVRQDAVICWDGQRDSEVAIEPVQERVSLLEADDATASSSAEAVPQTVSQPVEVEVTGVSASKPRFPVRPPAPQAQSTVPSMTEDEHKTMSEIVDRLRQLQSLPGADGNTATEAERLVLANKMISELRSSRVSPQETRKLENLGDEGHPRQ